MESEGSLQHSQAAATCSYPEPVQSSLCLPTQLFKNTYINYEVDNNSSHKPRNKGIHLLLM
jgi:hypothetical protein